MAQRGIRLVVSCALIGLTPLSGLTLLSASVNAQQPAAPKPAGPKTLVGVVTDTIGNPVDSV